MRGKKSQFVRKSWEKIFNLDIWSQENTAKFVNRSCEKKKIRKFVQRLYEKTLWEFARKLRWEIRKLANWLWEKKIVKFVDRLRENIVKFEDWFREIIAKLDNCLVKVSQNSTDKRRFYRNQFKITEHKAALFENNVSLFSPCDPFVLDQH